MEVKRYNTDWAKAKSRKIVKDTIAGTLLTFDRPENLRVLCFPGVDAAEIYQVYDSLGIPRTNIVGIEKDQSVANSLEARSLGIEIIRKPVEDYIASQRSIEFDIVSLDYTGPLSNQELETLDDMVNKQRKNQFVLHVTNLLKRDSSSTPLYHMGFGLTPYVKSSTVQESSEDEIMGKLMDSVAKWMDFFKKIEKTESFLKEKKLGYHSIIQMVCLNNQLGYGNDLLRFALGPHYETVLSSLEKEYGVSISRTDPFDYVIRGNRPPLQFLLQAATKQGLMNIASQIGFEEKPRQLGLVFALEDACRSEKFFINLDSTTYSYISETGAPIIGDVNFLVYPVRARNIARHIGRQLGFPSGQATMPRDQRKFEELLERYFDKLSELYTPERLEKLQTNQSKIHFLGSSAKPLLTKARAIEEFRNGASVNGIMEKYRGCNNKPLAQWKAHVTMGTYDGDRLDEVEAEETSKMSREDALVLIEAGIPLEEIVEAFPNETMSRLRAFKAHKTRGTYS